MIKVYSFYLGYEIHTKGDIVGCEKRDQCVHITMMYLFIIFDYCTSLASIRYVTPC